MKPIRRDLEQEVLLSAKEYPILAILGPRQSGKSTLVKMLFPEKKYVSLENMDIRNFAIQDPNSFIESYKDGAILDEIQRVPELFSYLQTEVDRDPTPGRFILTGSHQYHLNEKISQSLAGRVALLRLLPFSLHELKKINPSLNLNEVLFNGFYPRIHDQKLRPTKWLNNYIETYIDKDVRLIKNIQDLNLFSLFIKMCAARVGQLVNLQSIGNDCGIDQNTVKAWLSILESSFIIKRLQPHHKNFNKRLIKTPKLYFYDTGLLCQLLDIEKHEDLQTHPLRGGIFENYVIADLQKFFFNQGQKPPLYFWRDRKGHEIDCLVEKSGLLIPIEIKSGKTINSDFFKNLKFWKELTQTQDESFLVYAGEEIQKRKETIVIPWSQIESILK